jgi:hypothetical protein
LAAKDGRTLGGARQKGSREVTNRTRLFTFVVEHDGWSSISQTEGRDERHALEQWRSALSEHVGEIMSARQVKWMSQTLNAPIPITDRIAVWSVCALTRRPDPKREGGVAQILIVRTDDCGQRRTRRLDSRR